MEYNCALQFETNVKYIEFENVRHLHSLQATCERKLYQTIDDPLNSKRFSVTSSSLYVAQANNGNSAFDLLLQSLESGIMGNVGHFVEVVPLSRP
jgi:hypothetical protein